MKIPKEYLKEYSLPPDWLKAFSKAPPFFCLNVPFMHTDYLEKIDLNNNKYILLTNDIIEILNLIIKNKLNKKYRYIVSKEIYSLIPSSHQSHFCFYSFKSPLKKEETLKQLLIINFDQAQIAIDDLLNKIKEYGRHFKESHIYVLLNEHLIGETKVESSALVKILNQIKNSLATYQFIDLDYIEKTPTLSNYQVKSIKTHAHPSISYEEFLALHKGATPLATSLPFFQEIFFYEDLSLILHEEKRKFQNFIDNDFFKQEYIKLIQNKDQINIMHLIGKMGRL